MARPTRAEQAHAGWQRARQERRKRIAVSQLRRWIEANRRYRNLAPDGEPQLGKRGLYRATGGTTTPDLNLAMLWVLTLSDGWHDLLAVAERGRLPFATIRFAAERLREAGLLAE